MLHALRYGPATVTIKAGQTVTWKWEDAPALHDVSLTSFTSRVQATGTWSLQFVRSGTYRYHCTIHPTMTGTILVQ